MTISGETCTCGRALDEHDRHVRFELPTPIWDLPERERTPGTWLSHGTPRESVMMQVPGFGAFVRVLLPIQLEDGYTLTYGAWLGIHPDDLQRTFAAWWSPEYDELRVEGRLANTIAPWGLLGVPVTATVRDPDETPYLTESSDPLMARVIGDVWPHDEVLS
ncbi:DUF2199 domain-containing protein [Kribbella pittospori]|uniref:DUF2199 domain-containing protein n=1 Tax=Kribbella pittospori TaxID=722689 RepID=UPI0013F4B4DA|nr:DUF2199 domain-containing protein [Kribbella pittospori]